MNNSSKINNKTSKLIQKVLEISPLGAFQTDVEGNCFYLNKQWEQISGVSIERSLGRDWMNLVYQEDIPIINNILQEVFSRKQELFDLIYRLQHPLKGLVWVKVNAKCFFDKEGSVDYYIGFIEDITERRSYELTLKAKNEELERSNKLLDVSQELSKTGGWEYDVQQNSVFRTKQMKLMLGISENETSLEKAISFYEDEDSAAIQQGMKKAIEQHQTYDLEIRPLNQNKWFRTIGRPLVENGKVRLVMGAVTDITERKLHELAFNKIKEELERSNLLLDVSQSLSETAGWEVDLITGDVFWTKQNYLLYEVGNDFVPNLDNTRAFYKGEYRLKMDNAAAEGIEKQQPYDVELQLTTAKGRIRWVRAIGLPVVKDGVVTTLKGALMDITHRKEIELELIEAKNIAEHSAKVKTDFLSVMSHEIRTPLNGIIGIANLLKLKHTMDQEEYVRSLIFSADHLLQLINDILDLTKIESDKLDLVLAEVNIFELVRNIKNQFKSLAEAKGISIKSFVDDDIPERLIADPVRLGQILNNLVSNAVKFTEHGEITILLKLQSVTEHKARIHFSVKDTGMGIPPELHDTVFESFKQVQQAVHRKHTGTGLGLAITQKLVELHNSHIFMESVVGSGTEFYFDLDFDVATDKNTPGRFVKIPEITVHEGKLTGMRILFVEDNPINVMVAKKQLEYFGSVPDCAYSGKEALVLLENHIYDVALLDLHMPEIDGYALAEIIQKKYPDIHIVIFTADIMTDVKMRLAKMHIYDILNKPFSPERMFEVLYNVGSNRGILPINTNNQHKTEPPQNE